MIAIGQRKTDKINQTITLSEPKGIFGLLTVKKLNRLCKSCKPW